MSLRSLAFILLLPLGARAAGASLELPAPLQTALDSLRNGHYRQTLQAVEGFRSAFPGHPVPPLLAAEASWGLIFCQTGHINSREIWNEAEIKTSPFDERFFPAVEEALEASESLRKKPESAAWGAFYEGLAYGVRARLYTLRKEVLKSARDGKQMRAALLQAVEQRPDWQPDADAGLGVYNYYADVLSPFVKLIRFLLFLPGGDREAGLRQLESASQKALLLAPEARHELAKIYSVRENRPAQALPLLRSLADQYPDNALYALSLAIQAERLGQKALASEYAAKALASARGRDDVCRATLEPAAQQALDRLQSEPRR